MVLRFGRFVISLRSGDPPAPGPLDSSRAVEHLEHEVQRRLYGGRHEAVSEIRPVEGPRLRVVRDDDDERGARGRNRRRKRTADGAGGQ
jgi:hypothetical protein